MLRACRVAARVAAGVAAGVALGAAALLSVPLSAVASPSAASATPLPGAGDPDAMRVWSVWQSDGTAWLASSAGYSPPDGAVIGWRFSAAPDGAASESPGGELPSFEGVCGADPAGSGHKRVAVAVDFGDADTDAYPGERPPGRQVVRCVAGAEDATAARLLASAAKVRVDGQGDVVAVNDYPARQKGGAAVTAAAPAAVSGDGLPIALIAGGVGALALLGGTAVAATRHHRRKPAIPAGR
ncbi:SCO2322 family protein [Nonomuraea sp. SYSU D8015]|uniref:SCO2322 family protein n=1 Tax=Nonomuraea sp. SYSU D8015 TaxID=2593644 RepID=UPI0016608053|nr:SCO2322 family protein [Nonomuraea sp. SYSU D8015]